ncbi:MULTISPECIES: amino acid ABC transporter permease [Burkholderia]|uniref:amino acid ABC transporter permease n=1 Tax=Burkholderia TaxID=32008 RepID=UPI00064E6859|nr:MULTISPECIES: amino acid ABC transporter permease [Burkholderia]KML19719.1 ABC transporter permease [Burkholderia cepacia]KMN59561.1 ABC transporter permease [Burkholderia sp. LK4]
MDIFTTFFNLDVLLKTLPTLLQGFGLTVLLGATSLFFAVLTGLVLVLLRIYAPRPLDRLAVAYIDVFRSIPLLVLLVLVYYALPFVGIRLPPFWAATATLSAVASAYMAETFRAGIEAVPKGQFEAAQSLGFSWPRMMVDVTLPQAMRLVIPPATGVGVSLIKDTALASVVAMPDLLKQATQAQAFYANPSPLIGAAILYVLLLWPLVRFVGFLETRQKRRS